MVTRTTNFYLAAVFLSEGAELIGIDKSDMRHLKFEFDGKDLTQIEFQWDHRLLQINARSYSEAIKDIKMKIHQVTGE